jgi:hypothetical protein
LIVGPRQIIVGLVVDTNKMTVGIMDKYIQKVCNLLDLWDPNARFFKVNTMQKLVRKLARLGGHPMDLQTHVAPLYFLGVCPKKQYRIIGEEISGGFKDLVKQISTKNYSS